MPNESGGGVVGAEVKSVDQTGATDNGSFGIMKLTLDRQSVSLLVPHGLCQGFALEALNMAAMVDAKLRDTFGGDASAMAMAPTVALDAANWGVGSGTRHSGQVDIIFQFTLANGLNLRVPLERTQAEELCEGLQTVLSELDSHEPRKAQ